MRYITSTRAKSFKHDRLSDELIKFKKIDGIEYKTIYDSKKLISLLKDELVSILSAYAKSIKISLEYKEDIFDNHSAIITLFIDSNKYTIVYHYDIDDKNRVIQEYIVCDFRDYVKSHSDLLWTYGPPRCLIKAIVDFSSIFLSNPTSEIIDNIEFAENQIDNLTNKKFKDNFYDIIHQDQYYSSALLITRNTAIVYNLPTPSLSSSDTHIEQILCLKQLQEDLSTSSTPNLPCINCQLEDNI
ncbi:MAG: hypothetical protein IKR19_07820 [Acholeplasmatales bacterium]|nr:hypothetical protein [Acholeplasmatales bacterium]